MKVLSKVEPEVVLHPRQIVKKPSLAGVGQWVMLLFLSVTSHTQLPSDKSVSPPRVLAETREVVWSRESEVKVFSKRIIGKSRKNSDQSIKKKSR